MGPRARTIVRERLAAQEYQPGPKGNGALRGAGQVTRSIAFSRVVVLVRFALRGQERSATAEHKHRKECSQWDDEKAPPVFPGGARWWDDLRGRLPKPQISCSLKPAEHSRAEHSQQPC